MDRRRGRALAIASIELRSRRGRDNGSSVATADNPAPKKTARSHQGAAPMVIWLAPVFLESSPSRWLLGASGAGLLFQAFLPEGRPHIIPSTTATTKPNDRSAARALSLTCIVMPSPLKREFGFVSLPF